MKKILSAALACALCLALFAGCSAKKKVTINSEEDLKGLKIGAQSGTTGEALAQSIEGTTVSGFKSGMDAALDLKNGTIDCVILDELPAKSIVANNDDLEIKDLGFEKEEYAIAVKKGNTELLNAINDTLDRMENDGTFETLQNAFMPADGNVVLPETEKATGSGKFTIGTNAAFHPFEYTENDEVVGYDIEIANEIAKDLGKELVVENMEFDSLVNAVASGIIDAAIAGMSVTEEKLQNVDFSNTYYSSTQVVIVRK